MGVLKLSKFDGSKRCHRQAQWFVLATILADPNHVTARGNQVQGVPLVSSRVCQRCMSQMPCRVSKPIKEIIHLNPQNCSSYY